MRIFARLVFLCNICFLITVVLRFLERKGSNPVSDGLAAIQPLENSLIILGYGAIILNFIFVFVTGTGKLFKRSFAVPGWIIWFNIILLVLQFFYFFVLP